MSDFRSIASLRNRIDEEAERKRIEDEEARQRFIEEQTLFSMQPHRPGFEKDYSFLMEAEGVEEKEEDEQDEEEEKDDTSKEDKDEDNNDDDRDDTEEDNEESDDDSDLDDFGNNGGDDLPNNEYDPKEVETLNKLMASEADAMNEYLDAARESKVDVLQRMYADIANEERFHMEQLLFAKSELTGEKYVPRDKDVRKEYEELLALGMDEDTAMATAVDKVGIRVSITDNESDNEDLEADAKKLEEDVAALEMMSQQIELVSYICEWAAKTNNAEIINEINLIQESYFMEDVASMSTVDKKYIKSKNPFKVLWNLFKGFLKLLSNLSKSVKNFTSQLKYRFSKTREWVQKHSIVELFAGEGVFLYLWNDKKNTIDSDGFCFLANATWDLAKKCAQLSRSQNQVIQKMANSDLPFMISNPAYNKTFNKPEDIVQTLKNAILMKSKVVINDSNREYLTNLFFGPDTLKEAKIDSSRPVDPSRLINVYVEINYIIARIGVFSERSNQLLEALDQLEGEPNGIYHNNNDLYNKIGGYMKEVGKNFTKLCKIITHDFKQIESIANGQNPSINDRNPDNKTTQQNDGETQTTSSATQQQPHTNKRDIPKDHPEIQKAVKHFHKTVGDNVPIRGMEIINGDLKIYSEDPNTEKWRIDTYKFKNGLPDDLKQFNQTVDQSSETSGSTDNPTGGESQQQTQQQNNNQQQPQQQTQTNNNQSEPKFFTAIDNLINNKKGNPSYVISKGSFDGTVKFEANVPKKKAPMIVVDSTVGRQCYPNPIYVRTMKGGTTLENYNKIYGSMFNVEVSSGPKTDNGQTTYVIDNAIPTIVYQDKSGNININDKKGTVYLRANA